MVKLLICLLLLLPLCGPIPSRADDGGVNPEYWPRLAAEPYYSNDYLAQAQIAFRGPIFTYDDRGFWLPLDRSLPLFQVRHEFRRTTGQPSRKSRTLWILGSSVVYGWLTPDGYTLSSQIQQLLPNIRIENVGAYPANTDQQVRRLATLPVRKGDAILLYDDLTDIIQGSFDAQTFSREIDKAERIADSAGARLFVACPPYLFSAPLTEAESSFVDGAFRDQIETSWAIYEVAVAQAGGIDLTHSIDRLRGDQELFIDAFHLTSYGNEAVAWALYWSELGKYLRKD